MNGMDKLQQNMILFNRIYDTYKKGDIFYNEELMLDWIERLHLLVNSLIDLKTMESIRYYDFVLQKENELLNTQIKSDAEESLEKIRELEKMIEQQQKDGESNGY